MLGRVLSSARAWALLPLLALSAASCSLLLDFPEEGMLAGGSDAGASPGGGDVGGGGSFPICPDFAEAITVDKTTWRGEMQDPMPDYYASTTGLERFGNKLYVYGGSHAPFESVFTGTEQGLHELYLIEIPDGQPAELAASVTACGLETGLSGRITALSTGDVVISGSIGVDTFLWGPGNWSFSVGGPNCGQVAPFVLPSQIFNGAPFFAKVTDTDVLPLVPDAGSDGLGIDVDQRNGYVAAIGVTKGKLFESNAENADHRYFVQHSLECCADVTFVLDDHFMDYQASDNQGGAGIAVDEDGNAWFGGGSCNDQIDCDDQGAFFGVMPPNDGPEMIVERPGTRSTITTVRFADDRLLIGGRYDGELEMLGKSLPPSSADDAFVMAMDRDTRDILWTWPAAEGDPGYDRAAFNSVVDIAVLGDRDCGAVYVLGCTVPGGGSTAECATPKAKKHGFLAKLDFTTGGVVWSQDIQLENEDFDFFLPTAITAQGERVWMAATLNNSVTLAGTQVSGAQSGETVVFELSP
jgi:hypothetical protein